MGSGEEGKGLAHRQSITRTLQGMKYIKREVNNKTPKQWKAGGIPNMSKRTKEVRTLAVVT